MPRPSAAQLCLGTFTVVASAVALLAVSGAEGVLEVGVLVVFALALGTLVTVLSSVSARSSRVPAPASPGHEYARQR
ncbi:hypothetical protein F7Q99_09045 [Streptomyces kaniharaensis]|uniref:Uncharacterized protein n=1 Tax=Streptomyces kaniharaensis TaxID=212423 RepID=A0A6N7KPE3_9ACTN|nr:hypothetical protein [Streptomyces kaniharaensis]MQS12429.1 hypothetical protein [Streptomyces kaniharaensis]